MSIPIICLAKAEEPHRFEVAKVTSDLVCTTCKSSDIDFDESVAKVALDLLGRAPGGLTDAEIEEALQYASDNDLWGTPADIDFERIVEEKTRRISRKTASIDWKGDTHLGVGYLTGTAPNGDVYEVYSNPNSNPTPCSWVRYGPEGDTGLGSGIDAGRGYTTMQEAMAAAEEHAKGAAKTAERTGPTIDSAEGYEAKRKTAGGGLPDRFEPVKWHVYRSDHTGRGIPVEHGEDMLSKEHAEVFLMGQKALEKINPIAPNVNPYPVYYLVAEDARGIRVPYFGPVATLPPMMTSKQADFTDPEMDEVKDTSSVSQKVTCSSCLTEHVITAVDPAQPMPACPSCGRDTLSPGGSTLASRRTSIYTETGETYTQPCDTCGKPVTFRWLENEGGFRTSEPADGGGSDHLSTWCSEHTPSRKGSSLDAAFAALTKQADEESVCKNCGGEIRKADPDSAWKHTGDTECAKAAPGERAPAFASREERIAAKINQIADGVLATNPGMNRQSALAVAGKTLATYPSMIEGN